MDNDSPANSDETLLARLNALKKSHISLHRSNLPLGNDELSKASPLISHHETDLTSRFQRLKSSSTSHQASQTKALVPDESPTTVNEDEDDNKTLEELIAELDPEEQSWADRNPDINPKEIQKLLDEAQKVLPSSPDLTKDETTRRPPSFTTSHKETLKEDENGTRRKSDLDHSCASPSSSSRPSPSIQDNLNREGDHSISLPPPAEANAKTEDDDEDDDDDELAALTLQKILDSLTLEPPSPSPSPSPPPRPSNPTPSTASQPPSIDPPEDSFPSTPTTAFSLPSAPTTTLSQLPSVPTSTPSKSKPKPQEKGFTDQEIESWCVICLANASVKCLGCEGDLYCHGCWREGHVGRDVGLEERTHRWVRFRG